MTSDSAGADEARPWQVGTTVLDEFVVQRYLGGGGFGRVELVESSRSGKPYAVKRIVVADDVAQGRFLQEAQRWIGLPAHPHIANCYFVRTIGDEVAIFSEYVDGGSLADWIASRRLYDNGDEQPVERLLRIALQSAWGLHAAHTGGLLHLDVKPANVLVDERGGAKIADFGLASSGERTAGEVLGMEAVLEYLTDIPEMDARARERITAAMRDHVLRPTDDEPVRVAAAQGLSPAYASPEQAAGGELGRGTDVWSWALTVLEAFAGGRTWPAGPDAPIVLDDLMHAPDAGEGIAMPAGVAELLGDCFRSDPAARPASFEEVAVRLSEAGSQADVRLPEPPPPPPSPISSATVVAAREAGQMDWADPRAWLDFAYQAANEDRDGAASFWPSRTGSLRAQVLEDLRALSEALRVLESADSANDVEHLHRLGLLRGDRGRVRAFLGDAGGAIDDYRAAGVAFATVGPDAALDHAVTLTREAVLLRKQARREESLAASGRAVELSRTVDADVHSRQILASALLTDANTDHSAPGAMDRYDEAVRLFELAGDEAGHIRALAGKATGLEASRRSDEAGEIWKQVDTILDRLIESGRDDLLPVRATTLLNRATRSASSRDTLELAEAAVAAYTPLVEEQGLYGLSDELAQALFHAALGHEHAGRLQPALERYAKARVLVETAVVRDGRSDLADELALYYDHESTLVNLIGTPQDAIRLAREAVALWTRLAGLEGEDAWGPELALARVKLASGLGDVGELQAAHAEVSAAVESLEPIVAGGDSARARQVLGSAYAERGSVLRKAGELQASYESYEQAFALIADETGAEERREQARLLQNLSNTLADGGQLDEGLRANEQAVAISKELLDDSDRAIADLAAIQHNRVNKLVKKGDYAAAREDAATTLALYGTLIDRGRDDLLDELARLQMAYSHVLERLADPEAALASTRIAKRLYERVSRMDPEQLTMVREEIDRRLAALQDLLASGTDDVARWVAAAREMLDFVREISQNGGAEMASNLVEGAIAPLVYLSAKTPTDDLYAALGEAGLALGAMSFAVGRTGVARHGFSLAIESRAFLVTERGRTDLVDEWGKAYLGLAVLVAYHGDFAAADELVDDMKRRLRPIDRRKARRWVASVREELKALRAREG